MYFKWQDGIAQQTQGTSTTRGLRGWVVVDAVFKGLQNALEKPGSSSLYVPTRHLSLLSFNLPIFKAGE